MHQEGVDFARIVSLNEEELPTRRGIANWFPRLGNNEFQRPMTYEAKKNHDVKGCE